MEASGYEVLTARDRSMAVELAVSGEPDLILLDVGMLGLSGYEACRRIRQFSRAPIILFTVLAENAGKA
jgi:DNA-binding response OmpR family regulator